MEKFTVTIARGFGSGGRTIGKMLADKLGVKSVSYTHLDVYKRQAPTTQAALLQLAIPLQQAIPPRLMAAPHQAAHW